MNKTLSIFAAAIMATTVAATADSAFQGVYGGAKLGRSSNSIGVEQKAPSNLHLYDASAAGMTGGVFVGYRQMFDNIAAGIEAGYNLENSKPSDAPKATPGISTATELKAGNSMDLAATLGTTLTPKALAFVKAGIRNQKLTFNMGNFNETPVKKSKTSFLMGVGADIQVGDQVLVRGEYTHTFEAKITGNNATVGDSSKAKFTNDSFTVGVVFKIG